MSKSAQLKKTVQKKLSEYFSDKRKKYIKIGILGTHGTGKTTLGHTIMSYLKTKHVIVGWVSEIVRDCPFPVNERANFLSQYWILNRQINKEIEAQNRNNVIVTDRTVVDNYAYAIRAANKDNISNNDLYVLKFIAQNWVKTYDFLFYTLRVNMPIEIDGFRSNDLKFQIEIDEMIKKILREWNLKVVKLSGSNVQRHETVLETINKHQKLNIK